MYEPGDPSGIARASTTRSVAPPPCDANPPERATSTIPTAYYVARLLLLLYDMFSFLPLGTFLPLFSFFSFLPLFSFFSFLSLAPSGRSSPSSPSCCLRGFPRSASAAPGELAHRPHRKLVGGASRASRAPNPRSRRRSPPPARTSAPRSPAPGLGARVEPGAHRCSTVNSGLSPRCAGGVGDDVWSKRFVGGQTGLSSPSANAAGR